MPSPTPTSTISPTHTLTPIPDPALYVPIQTFMAENRPFFEDDFSTQNPIWGYDHQGNSISGFTNKQTLYLPPYARKIPSNALLYIDDFAICFDYAIATNDTGSFEFVFRASPDESAFYKFVYDRGGLWELVESDGGLHKVVRNGKFEPVKGSEDCPRDVYKYPDIPLNNFLFIVYKENLAVFINQDLVLEFNDLGQYGDANFILNSTYSWSGKLDNFKYWQLNNDDQ